jgi:hypothetical protein
MTPAAAYQTGLCSRTACQISQAPPISASAAMVNSQPVAWHLARRAPVVGSEEHVDRRDRHLGRDLLHELCFEVAHPEHAWAVLHGVLQDARWTGGHIDADPGPAAAPRPQRGLTAVGRAAVRWMTLVINGNLSAPARM